MIVFKYKTEISSKKQKIIRPVAEVYLKALSNSWIKFYPYIDSGADITIIPLSLGKLLGFNINESKVQQIGGIRGSVPVIFIKSHLKIGNEEFPTSLAWALIEDIPPLLGRTDVFDIFKVTFEQYKRIIIFEKH